MAIVELHNNAPDVVLAMDARQVASNCGNGNLLDDSSASELRDFLTKVSVGRLNGYVDDCLTINPKDFPNKPYMLQDVVNEMGRRLGFGVTNGRYKGSSKKSEIGFDGLWVLPTGEAIVVEVKTTDAYRISLKTIDDYRLALIEQGEVTTASTNLIVVLREDTGDLEAQVRGSHRYAENTRIAGVEALSKMASLSLESEKPEVITQIHSILRPAEYTRVDEIVEMVFITSKDKGSPEPIEIEGHQQSGPDNEENTSIAEKREAIVKEFSDSHNTAFIRRKRASFSDDSDETRLVIAVSKRHEDTPDKPYWYAFRGYQQEYLEEKTSGYYVLGCLDSTDFFAIPISQMKEFAKEMRSSSDSQGIHHHHHVEITMENNDYKLYLSSSKRKVTLSDFLSTHH